MADAGQGIIQRKVAAARAEVAAGGPGADRGWRLALARAMRDKLKTTLDFRSLSVDRRSLGEVIDLTPDRALIAVLDGPGEGLGVFMISAPVLAGIIEAQTIGRVKSTELAARKPTRTDAAMVAGLIDTALRGLDNALADEADLAWAGGFRYASFLDDPRPLGLILEDTTYRLLRAEVDLAGGARVGEILLAMPAEGRGLVPNVKPVAGQGNDHGHVFVQALSERVHGAHSGLEAVLARVTMSIQDVMDLTEGFLLPLQQAGLDRISLEGLDGRRVAEGRLGQNRGMRAIRLNDDVEGAASGTEGHYRSTGQEGGAEMAMGSNMGGEMPALDFDTPDFGSISEGEMAFPMTGTD